MVVAAPVPATGPTGTIGVSCAVALAIQIPVAAETIAQAAIRRPTVIGRSCPRPIQDPTPPRHLPLRPSRRDQAGSPGPNQPAITISGLRSLRNPSGNQQGA